MLTKSIPNTFVLDGYFYFSHRVPSDLRQHYSYHRIVQVLGTSSPQRARVQANIAAAKWALLEVTRDTSNYYSVLSEPKHRASMRQA
jgi:hypothetical protein